MPLPQIEAAGHTPTLTLGTARVHSEDLRGGRYWVITIPGLSETIDIHDDDNGEANAAFLVRAINSHPALVAALEAWEADHRTLGKLQAATALQMRAALALASAPDRVGV